MKIYQMLATSSFTAAFLSLSGTALASSTATNYWGFCKDNLAYSDAAMTVRRGEADWVCAAPAPQDTGDAAEPNTARCVSGQRRECEVGAGGDPALAQGSRDVPRDAWYWVPGTSDRFPDVRCQCGCFSGDVMILTTSGMLPISKLASSASAVGGYSVATVSNGKSALAASPRLFNKDFTVGPETKDIYNVETESGQSLTMTDSHPVVILTEEGSRMVQAKTLTLGTRLLQADGRQSHVTAISTWQLPFDANKVYNLDTHGKSDADHVIVANGLQVGDLYWQHKLSERASRAANLTHGNN